MDAWEPLPIPDVASPNATPVFTGGSLDGFGKGAPGGAWAGGFDGFDSLGKGSSLSWTPPWDAKPLGWDSWESWGSSWDSGPSSRQGGSWDGSWDAGWDGKGGGSWPIPSGESWDSWWTEEWNKMISTWKLAGAFSGKATGKGGAGKSSGKEGKEAKGKGTKRKGKDLNPHAKVFVGGMNKETKVDSVREHFALFFGPVVDVELKYDAEGNFRCFGFVTFEEEDSAKKACIQSREYPLDGKVLECRPAVPQDQRTGPDPTGEASKIYCGGLPKTTTPEEVKVYFACKYGPVQHVDFKFDPEGNFRGFCFVIFEDPSCANSACTNPEGNNFQERWLDCKPAMRMQDKGKGGGKGDKEAKGKDSDTFESKGKKKGKKGDDPNYDPKNPPEKVFVGGLPRTVTAERVLTHFSQYGQVANVDLKMDEQGSFRGFGFVIFQDKAGAELACAPENAGRNLLDGKKFDVRPSVRQPELLLKGKGAAPPAAAGALGMLAPGAATAPTAGFNAASLSALLGALPGLSGLAAAASIAGAGSSPGSSVHIHIWLVLRNHKCTS